MKRLLTIFFLFLSLHSFPQAVLPVPDHIVIVLFENHAYNQIIGSPEAPHINALANSSKTALFTQSYAIEYPSQPNYLDLFSGFNQGVTDALFPQGAPFTTPNLARQLLDAGKTFITYSEDLPYPGFNGESSGYYVRRHNPVANWMGNGPNQVPASVNQPLTAFPSDFNLLPTVCFVVPNLVNDMHDGSIAQGDQWMVDHLSEYIQWAKSHNSLFILTFDEDDKSMNNQIVTIFSGEMVKGGNYSGKINHYSLLRTIEQMYGLPYAGHAATARPITDCWVEMNPDPAALGKDDVLIYHNHPDQSILVEISEEFLLNNLTFALTDVHGATARELAVRSHHSTIPLAGLSSGVYIYQLRNQKKVFKKGKLMVIN
ncbi:MAG TPA: alkaline phosphatase family protein [Prolixibacteraceae bacterium]|nr:alkaline phosphatase family protein [Prolixibacteraceae bacterium]